MFHCFTMLCYFLPYSKVNQLYESPWTAGTSNQSILKEINPEYSREGLMLKLKLQSFGHLMGQINSLEKTLMLGKFEGRRKRGWQRMSWSASLTRWTWVWASSRSWWWTGKSGVLQSIGVAKSRTRLSNWTELNWHPFYRGGIWGSERWRLLPWVTQLGKAEPML